MRSFRGVLMDGDSIAVVNSQVSDIHYDGFDSQAVGGSGGQGPYKIVNNVLEAAGENIMFGGARPTGSTLSSDIEIRDNYVRKPVEWEQNTPRWDGSKWTIKNLLEIKSGRRILVENNVFDNNWLHAQNGHAVLLTVATSQSGCQAVVDDITFRGNIIRNTHSGFGLLGRDGGAPNDSCRGELKRLLVEDNLVIHRNDPQAVHTSWSTAGAIEDVVFKNNTFGWSGPVRFGFFFSSSIPNGLRFGMYNNIMARQPLGDSMAWGSMTLNKYFGQPLPIAERYKGNFMYLQGTDTIDPRTPRIEGNIESSIIPFINPSAGNFRLRPGFTGGANIDALELMSNNVTRVGATSDVNKLSKNEGTSSEADGLDVSIQPLTLSAQETANISASSNGQPIAVRWEVEDNLGTITGESRYTAPSLVPSTRLVRLCAYPTQGNHAPSCGTVLLRAKPRVVVTPNASSVAGGQSLQLKAAITEATATISWRVEPQVGSIDATGRYTAPAAIESMQVVRVIASTNTISSTEGVAELTLHPPSLSLSVTSAKLASGQQLPIRATAVGTLDPRVEWTFAPAIGTLVQSGTYYTYQAPARIETRQEVRITAKLTANAQVTAQAVVTLEPVSISVTPQTRSLQFGESVLLWPAVTGTYNSGYTWTVSPAIGSFVKNPNTLLYTYNTAPAGTPDQRVTLTVSSLADPSKTAQVTLTLIPPRVNVVASSSLNVLAGQSRVLTATVYDTMPAFRTYTWNVKAFQKVSRAGTEELVEVPLIGTFDPISGRFSAPSRIDTQTLVQVTATSSADPRQSASLTLTLLP
jgi:hypothetical protein